MPHPRKHLKLTGDVHPPELEYGFDTEDDEETERGDEEPAAQLRPPTPTMIRRTGGVHQAEPSLADDYVEQARHQVRAKPLAVMAAAFGLGFLLYRLFR